VRLFLALVLLCCVPSVVCARGAAPDAPFPVFHRGAGMIQQAMEQAPHWELPEGLEVSGVIVPHHLLAADMIVATFAALAQGNDYDRVVILSPDHFFLGSARFSVTDRDFRTVLGPVASDKDLVAALLDSGLCARSSLFVREHGVRALLPFIAHWFPEAKVVAVAVNITTTQEQCDAFIDLLEPFLDQRTLVVQSTDFSHYLPLGQARIRDRQTLHQLYNGEPGNVFRLTQPGHLDSLACHYIQSVIQARYYGALPSVLANRNSQYYAPLPQEGTTSYIAAVYAPLQAPPQEAEVFLHHADSPLANVLEKAVDTCSVDAPQPGAKTPQIPFGMEKGALLELAMFPQGSCSLRRLTKPRTQIIYADTATR
jgi:AmmeMemoRadiSam system protein B